MSRWDLPVPNSLGHADRFAGVHVVPGGELAEGSGLDGRDGVDVEVGESFQARELGVVDASGAASFGAVIDLGSQDFGEVAQVGLPFPCRDLGQPRGFGADGRQVQLACRCADRGLRGRINGARRGGHVPLPVSSWS